ncbi:glutamate-rich protein 2 isoform X2 [Colossoma macropomum]|uniref:glutamate-rich protein 2 isoform X2 n=1 Tax=Colossoma macropomum TaxID=42526 RepID=UPI001864B3B6|nr:glutamate-rich protein 2 isoform X2 [Colossoma macropomum]
MSRLLCVGSSSKLPAKGGVPVKVGVLSSREPPINKSGHSKPRSPKSQSSTQPEGKQPSVISDRGQVKVNSSRSEAGAVLQAPSQADETTHGEKKLAKHASPVGAEVQIVSAEFVEKMHQDGPILKVPQYLGVLECQNSQGTSEEESGDDEECREDEETAEHRAPIELLAEFLKAVMGKDYPLAKKLCQMILIYEPENLEAKHFLPLIEERILIEAQEGSSSEDKSDETDEESTDDDGDDDDDDDDDEDSSSCDSDEELTGSNSSSSDEKEEHISECSRAPLPPQL